MGMQDMFSTVFYRFYYAFITIYCEL